jgi:ABC-type oligopeptide transport system substrate-binding subunit
MKIKTMLVVLSGAVLAGCVVPLKSSKPSTSDDKPNRTQVVKFPSSGTNAPVSAVAPAERKLIGSQQIGHYSVKFINFSAEPITVVLNHDEDLLEIRPGDSSLLKVSTSAKFLIYEVRSGKQWTAESLSFDHRFRFYTVRVEGDKPPTPVLQK